MVAYPCDQCGHTPTQYQTFSGGEEYYCPACEDVFPYRRDAESLPRAALVRTAEGRARLRELQRAELERRASDPKVTVEQARAEQSAWLSEAED